MSVDGIALRYGGVARQYKRYWAPPLLAFSKPLLNALPFEPGARVLDLGAGTGVIAAAVSRTTGRGSVVALDLTAAMLRQARVGAPLPVVADLRHLPLGDSIADIAVTTFVLQHLASPGVVMKEARRVLKPGGVFGTVTWGPDAAESAGAYDVIERIFERRKVPADELIVLKTFHHKVDSVAKLKRSARAAGLTVQRAWISRVVYEWSPAAMLGWVSSMGPYGRRLAALDPERRQRVVHEIEHRFAKLPPDAFIWAPEVVFMLAAKD